MEFSNNYLEVDAQVAAKLGWEYKGLELSLREALEKDRALEETGDTLYYLDHTGEWFRLWQPGDMSGDPVWSPSRNDEDLKAAAKELKVKTTGRSTLEIIADIVAS